MLGLYRNLNSLAFTDKAWIPSGKCGTKTTIDQLSADLQEGVCAHR